MMHNGFLPILLLEIFSIFVIWYYLIKRSDFGDWADQVGLNVFSAVFICEVCDGFLLNKNPSRVLSLSICFKSNFETKKC